MKERDICFMKERNLSIIQWSDKQKNNTWKNGLTKYQKIMKAIKRRKRIKI